MISVGGESPSNGAEKQIEMTNPFTIRFTIEGVCEYLYHRWNNESVAEKAKAPKGSKAKKSDDIESFVYRDENGFLAIPSEQVRMAIINAAKFKQDPRSPRKSAMDLYKAALIFLTKYASTGKKEWDFEDKRRVVVQRNAITRTRPALKTGWQATFDVQIILPEYISYHDLHDTLSSCGKLIGIGDFRPSYGRFQINKFTVI